VILESVYEPGFTPEVAIETTGDDPPLVTMGRDAESEVTGKFELAATILPYASTVNEGY
jgi:hypothetical protein